MDIEVDAASSGDEASAHANDLGEKTAADPNSPVSDSQDAFAKMMAAAKEATAAYKGEKPAAQTDIATTDDAAAPATPAVPATATARLQALLSARESNAKERVESRQYQTQIQQLQAELQSMKQQLQKPPAQAEDPYELFRQNPTAFFERAKMTPEEAQLVQLKAGSPEMVMYQKALAAERRAEAVAKQFEEFKAQLKTEREQEQQARGEQVRTATENEFLQSAEKTSGPMAKLAKTNPQLALLMGHNVVAQLRKKNAEASCTDADILEYLNSTLAVTGSGVEPVATEKPIPSQNGAKVPRTLTASRVASERRTTPKDARNLTEKEQEDAMRSAAREALSAKR